MRKRLQTLLTWLSLGLTVAAVVRELRTPPEERTWHGQVAGFVPYDFRPPTLDRFIQAFWRPDDARLLLPMAFGVGWSVNVGRLARIAGAA